VPHNTRLYSTAPLRSWARLVIRVVFPDGRFILRPLGKLGIDARRQLAVMTYCVHTFFGHYPKGTSGSRLNISSPLYSEIQVLE
jgi:hypothetical protein